MNPKEEASEEQNQAILAESQAMKPHFKIDSMESIMAEIDAEEEAARLETLQSIAKQDINPTRHK